MNIYLIIPKNETEGLLLSKTKFVKTLIKQTYRKAKETLEFPLIKSREIIHFKPALSIEGSWMLGLTSIKVFSSIFNITQFINKFELYTDNFDEFSFTELKNELGEILDISNHTPEHLQHEKIGPSFIQALRH